MAKAKKTIDQGKAFEKAYKDYVLNHGVEPPSVYKFASDLGVEEPIFYEYFSSFSNIKSQLWQGYIHNTISTLKKDKSYADYTVREKLLAFYYTLIEALKQDRSFVVHCLQGLKKTDITPDFLKKFKDQFNDYANELIGQGIENQEIKDRPVIGKRYHDAMWLQLLFVLNFWAKDTSHKFESTDAAVEKAVNLSFDLLGPGPLDTIVDFAKFLYQHSR